MIARLNVGGPARHVVWLTKEFQPKEFQPKECQDDEFQTTLAVGSVPEGEEDMSYFAAENGVEPVFIPEMSRELSIKDLSSLHKAYRLLKRERPDIIHTHTAKAGVIGRGAGFLYRWLTPKTLLGKPRRVKIVHTFHGHIFHSYYGSLKTKIFLMIEKMLARFATDKIVVITEQQFEEIHHKFGVGKKEQFEMIPLGIDLEKFDNVESNRNALRSELNLSSDEILVGFVGRLTAIKNVSLLIKAARLYHEERQLWPQKLKFVIIGDGELRSQLEKEAEGLEELLTFAGNRNDPEVFYAGLDIIALTSHNEGTPLSLIEAMACGKPFVSTEVGGVVDLAGPLDFYHYDNLRTCERGLLSAPDSARALLRGFLFLAGDPHSRRKLGESGKAYAISRFSKARLFNDLRSLYRRLV